MRLGRDAQYENQNLTQAGTWIASNVTLKQRSERTIAFIDADAGDTSGDAQTLAALSASGERRKASMRSLATAA